MSERQETTAPVPQTLSINVCDEVHVTERLKVARIRAGQRKPDSKVDARDDIDHKTGRPTWKQLVLDHLNDLYSETVTVTATGEVIVNKTERLSEHRGYGSAKKKADPSK